MRMPKDLREPDPAAPCLPQPGMEIVLPMLAVVAAMGAIPQLDKDQWEEKFRTLMQVGISSGAVGNGSSGVPEGTPVLPAPQMPVGPNPWPWEGHRPKKPIFKQPMEALVARPVQGVEKKTDPGARAALKKEWDRLRAIKTWDEDTVQSYWDAVRDLKLRGKPGKFARIFDLCVEKNSELPKKDKRRKFKGRVVYGGNRVWDESGEVALFEEINSCPSTMEAAKSAFAYGMLDGHTIQVADATQAYTQAHIDNSVAEHWVEIPEQAWPDHWWNKDGSPKYKRPVCRLELALYGHPNSGGYWEQHCEKHLRAQGFEDVQNWRSCFWHPRLELFLVVYVDDFLMSGPRASMEEA